MAIPSITIGGLTIDLTDLVRQIVKEEQSPDRDIHKKVADLEGNVTQLSHRVEHLKAELHTLAELQPIARISALETQLKNHPLPAHFIPNMDKPRRQPLIPRAKAHGPIAAPRNPTLWKSDVYQTLAEEITNKTISPAHLKMLEKIGWTNPTYLKIAAHVIAQTGSAKEIAAAIGAKSDWPVYYTREKLAKTKFPRSGFMLHSGGQ